LTKKTFPTVAKQVTAKKIINLVYKDLHSFDIIVGEGFREFSQEMINISATYGCLSVDNLFSHQITISRNIIKEVELIKSKLAIKLKDVFELVDGIFTTNM